MKTLVLFFLMAVLFISYSYVNANIIYIPEDYSTIQEALIDAAEGDTLLLSPDIYREAINIENHGVTISSYYLTSLDSSYIYSTVLNQHGQDRIITIDSTVSTTVRVVGLTLADANRPNQPDGSAIYAVNVDIIINNCRIVNNASRSGAIFLSNGYLELTNNYLSLNICSLQGGALSIYESIVNVSDNSFVENGSTYFSGAIHLSSCSGEITRNTFTGNWAQDVAGVVYAYSTPDEINKLSINENIFRNNVSTNAGAAYLTSLDTVNVSNNVFDKNMAIINEQLWPFAGGLYLGADCIDARIYSNEFYHNYALKKGGAIVIASSSIIYDNLFYKNQGDEVYTVGTVYSNGNNGMEAILYNNLFYENTRYTGQFQYERGCISTDHDNIMTLYSNDFYGNSPHAAGVHNNPDFRGELFIENNYWGDPTGPYHETQNPGGLGDSVMTELDVLPFSTTPFTTRWLREPEPFDLILPEAGAFLNEETVQFLWHAAADSTPHDTLRYTLEIADNIDFTDALLIDTDLDTSAVVNNFVMETGYYWRVKARDIYDLETYSTETRHFLVTSVDETDSDDLPTEWAIDRIYPNPFNSAVQVVVAVPRPDDVTITVFDLQGRLVKTLQRGSLAAGRHQFGWWPDGAAGMYFVRVSAGSWQEIRKVVYVK